MANSGLLFSFFGRGVFFGTIKKSKRTKQPDTVDGQNPAPPGMVKTR